MTADELTWNAEDFLRMYKELTDPEAQADRRRAEERKKRREEKMADTGAYII